MGRKDDTCISMAETDMLMADLSYATLNNIDGRGAIFLDAILFHIHKLKIVILRMPILKGQTLVMFILKMFNYMVPTSSSNKFTCRI